MEETVNSTHVKTLLAANKRHRQQVLPLEPRPKIPLASSHISSPDSRWELESIYSNTPRMTVPSIELLTAAISNGEKVSFSWKNSVYPTRPHLSAYPQTSKRIIHLEINPNGHILPSLRIRQYITLPSPVL